MQGTNLITQYRTAIVALLTAYEDLRTLHGPYVALDAGNVLTDGDFTQGHSDISKADFVAAIGSIEAFEAEYQTLAGAGHLTNLYKMRA